MVLFDQTQRFVAEVLSASGDGLHRRWTVDPGDVTLRYLAEARISPEVFACCLYAVLGYIFNFRIHRRVFISLPASVPIPPETLEIIGCYYLDTDGGADEMVRVYACTPDTLSTFLKF